MTAEHSNASATDSLGNSYTSSDWTYSYDDPTNPDQLSFSNQNYDSTKSVVSLNQPVYNISNSNFRLGVTLSSYNGNYAETYRIVKIANIEATLTMYTNNGEGADEVFRSKSSGTKTYLLYATSDQDMLSVDIDRDSSDNHASTVALPSFSKVGNQYQASITIKETDIKTPHPTVHNFEPGDSTFFGRNLANIGTDNALVADATYKIRGFEERQGGPVPQTFFDATYSAIGTSVTDTSKLVFEYVGIGSGTYQNSLADNPGTRNFTIVDSAGNLDPNGTHVRCCDSNIIAVNWSFRIEETAE